HLLQEFEDRLRLLRVVHHGGPGAGLDVAPQVEPDAASRGQVDRLERQLGRAAQLKAAACEDGERDEGEEAHQTTMLIRRLGMTMTFLITRSPVYRLTRSLARTIASSSREPTDFGTANAPLFLPLTWTT